MSRGDEASAPVYNRHMNMLKKRYGDVAMINLLGTKEGEDVVSKAFHRHHQVIRATKNLNSLSSSLPFFSSPFSTVLYPLIAQAPGSVFLQASIHAQDVPLIYFDYHSECRGGKVERIEKLKPKLEDVIQQHNFFLKVKTYFT